MVKSGGKRERTRRRLIEATLSVIAEHGFAAASIDEIAARAGVSTGSIYSNYKSKAALLWDAANSRALRLAPRLAPAGSLADHARETARALMALIPQARANAAFHRELQLYIQSDPELRQRQTAQYSALFDSIATELQARFGKKMQTPPRTLALAIQALIWGFIVQWEQTPEEITEDVVARAFEALIRGALREG